MAPAWRSVSLADGCLILEHVEPEEWFQTRFAPFGGLRSPEFALSPSEVLATAWTDLAPILFTHGLLAAS
jgi:hypothetical protein